MAKRKDVQWVRWALAGSLIVWSATSMAWSFGSSPQAPVEEAQADGGSAPVGAADEQSDTHVSDQEDSQPSYSTERATWEDSTEESRGEKPKVVHHEPSPNEVGHDVEPDIDQLSRQVNAIASMNLPGRIDELQQSLASLRGQLQVQQRDIEQLKAKLSVQTKTPAVFRRKTTNTLKPKEVSAVKTPVSASSSSISDQKTYSQAFDALMKKQYSEAKAGFLNYVQHYSNGSYISNAYYWLAEIALVKRDYGVAQKCLNTVITQYPTSSKYPDARYKLAMTHLKMHQTAKARKELQDLSHEYAGKTVGRLASIALEQLDLDQ